MVSMQTDVGDGTLWGHMGVEGHGLATVRNKAANEDALNWGRPFT